jgi:putative oxidoreductase
MNLPAKMKAVRFFEYGDPSVLKYIDVDLPEMGDDDVLIRVQATAINSFDVRYRNGILANSRIPGRADWPMPFQLGRDGAGDVVAVGRNVTRWKIGDRVVQMIAPACGQCPMCLLQQENLCTNIAYPGHQIFGAYAQYISRPQETILPIPANVSYEIAGSTLWAYTTPFGCAMRRAPTGIGKTVVITGASGGLALASLQLAKLGGARVIGTTTKIERRERLMELGYDDIVDINDPHVGEHIKRLTNGLGADACWETIGGSRFLALALSMIRLGGTIAVIATPNEHSGSNVEVPSSAFIFYELNLMGVRGGTRHDQQVIMELLGQGKIRPVIDRAFPLSAAAEAHAYLEGQNAIGKVILLPQEGSVPVNFATA